MDVEKLLALVTSVQALTVKRLANPYLESGLRLTSFGTVGKNMAVGNYYSSLFYVELCKEAHKTKRNGEGVM